jgi:hypothetical protein
MAAKAVTRASGVEESATGKAESRREQEQDSAKFADISRVGSSLHSKPHRKPPESTAVPTVFFKTIGTNGSIAGSILTVLSLATYSHRT